MQRNSPAHGPLEHYRRRWHSPNSPCGILLICHFTIFHIGPRSPIIRLLQCCSGAALGSGPSPTCIHLTSTSNRIPRLIYLHVPMLHALFSSEDRGRRLHSRRFSASSPLSYLQATWKSLPGVDQDVLSPPTPALARLHMPSLLILSSASWLPSVLSAFQHQQFCEVDQCPSPASCPTQVCNRGVVGSLSLALVPRTPLALPLELGTNSV